MCKYGVVRCKCTLPVESGASAAESAMEMWSVSESDHHTAMGTTWHVSRSNGKGSELGVAIKLQFKQYLVREDKK